MNLLLFDPLELDQVLPSSDPRALHLLKVLRRGPGEAFDAGLVNGPRGKACITSLTTEGLRLSFAATGEPPPLAPLRLLIGLPRPQTARKILLEATTLGVSAMDFVLTEKGEPGYAQSTLWHSGEAQRLLRDGAAQAFCTRLPALSSGKSLPELLAVLPPDSERIALDNYESPEALGSLSLAHAEVVLALGSERGWSATERRLLREAGFRFAHLGPRVLRTETATTAATTLLLAKLGRL